MTDFHNYKFNGGRGAVLCLKCSVIIDEDISHQEYLEAYGVRKSSNYCYKCFKKLQKEGKLP